MDSLAPTISSIAPKKVRFVKLGLGGTWEKECKERGILRFGFESADPEALQLCREGRWDEIARGWRDDGEFEPGTATNFTNQMREFFDDKGETLWVTFINDELHYGFLEPSEPQRAEPGNDKDWSSFRKMHGGWRSADANGEALTRTSLPGTITKLSMFRGTSCNVADHEYLVNRINAQRSVDVVKVDEARKALLEALAVLIRRLHDRDFELLIDMAFINAGWRRLGRVGGNEPVKDLDLEMPLTRDRAYVQVKCEAHQAVLESAVKDFEARYSYARMFFVYHTSAKPLENRWQESGVSVMGAEEVARMTLEGGLLDWVTSRVK